MAYYIKSCSHRNTVSVTIPLLEPGLGFKILTSSSFLIFFERREGEIYFEKVKYLGSIKYLSRKW